ncbi:hypothetical protein S40285_09971 [Stachybotrys chlorohalonatus IBT 40285]|uniref:Uncharacterized protein n=1 Tax=Stachybotrys chlorohalonatus (strain IBT 40285) TaxID=1283841 RepID=A0A084QG28_STAC4|nr:hypothetical protein S40285_09971 [Stachybotrys chlorohalonata IBT 40285]
MPVVLSRLNSSNRRARGCSMPLELILEIAHHLLPSEPFLDGSTEAFVEEMPDCKARTATLRSVASTCRSAHALLEPLLYRFILLQNGRQIMSLMILLIDRQELRKYVRHVAYNLNSDRSTLYQGGGCHVWRERFGSYSYMDKALTKTGLCADLSYMQSALLKSVKACDDDGIGAAFGILMVMLSRVETLSHDGERVPICQHGTRMSGVSLLWPSRWTIF